ncbi:MAG: YggS family pyridoxal phosphate-dependent enzyme [bacterium]|nr:MAG: YggS family pyridoxal phosphate-dependent enzyme [bacterium]
MADIVSNLKRVKERVAAAAARAGRPPGTVLVLAVSKTVPTEAVLEAVRGGQTHFGENRVQEARDKIPLLPEGLTWHLVGHLQKNKARYCPELFSWIHSIDSVELALEVARRYQGKGRVCRTLVQVSLSGEESKFGCKPAAAAGIIRTLMEQESTRPVGLMTMPPYDPDPETARPWFQGLRSLRDDLLRQGLPPETLAELSMGMTGDFEVAIEEGATIVRIGTAVFGERGY